MSLITETNQQYYQGAQGFRGDGDKLSFPTTFDTDLILGSFDPNDTNYALNNFKLYTNVTGLPGDYKEYITEFSVVDNSIVFLEAPVNNLYIVVQLKKLDGGIYVGDVTEKAYGQTVEDNYGSYSYITLNDAIDNFMVGYVGDGKLIQTAKKSDILFHAKRGLQEFSYDTLKSIRSQELTIPPSLTLALPQDYVNYVKCSWIDDAGAKHIIYPTRVTSNPNELPIQDQDGNIEQNFFGENNYAEQSITEERWADQTDINNLSPDDYRYPRKEFLLGQRYGLQPEEAQVNGKFTINERLGTFSFSSDLVNKLIILEYISDGLSDCDNECIPKMAEQAMYMHIAHAILSTRMNVPEYIINRYKRERSSALRTAKIRLSNIKIEEISQVFRNKGKWVKH